MCLLVWALWAGSSWCDGRQTRMWLARKSPQKAALHQSEQVHVYVSECCVLLVRGSLWLEELTESKWRGPCFQRVEALCAELGAESWFLGARLPVLPIFVATPMALLPRHTWKSFAPCCASRSLLRVRMLLLVWRITDLLWPCKAESHSRYLWW